MISLDRIRQRKVFQWVLAYLAGAWLLLQVLSLLAQPFDWPDIVLRVTTVILGAGFFVVLILAWYHGERGRQHIGGVELLMLAALFLLAGAAVWWVREDPTPKPTSHVSEITPLPPELNSIAVLPFTDNSPGKDQEYFSDGITEEILNALAQVEGLRVAARTSSFSFKGRKVPIDSVAQRLRVAHVLEGSVQKVGERVRINAQLIDASNGYHIWSDNFAAELTDIFAVEEEISRAIVDSLRIRLTGQKRTDLVKPATASKEAHELYFQGRQNWASRTPEGLRRAIQYFERAIDIDSSYARAHQGLADALIVLPLYTDANPADVQARAKAHAMRALSLDSTIAEAHASLGYVRMSFDRDWAGAEPEFRTALRLNPNYSTAHHWYGDFLAATGRVNESIQYYERAARLDPLSTTINFSLGWLYMAQRRFDDAIRQFHHTLAMDSTVVESHTHLARTRLFQGQHAEAIAGLENAVQRSGRRSMELAFLGHAYAVAGRANDAKRILTELQSKSRSGYVSPLAFAIIHIGLGENDQAFIELDKARAAGDPWLTENNFDLVFDSLRADTRWLQLMKSMGLKG